MRYLLDTDTSIYIACQHLPQVHRRLQELTYGQVHISVITEFELSYGALKSITCANWAGCRV